MNDSDCCCIKTPFGPLRLEFANGKLAGLEFMEPGSGLKRPMGRIQESAAAQIRNYLKEPQTRFDYEFPDGGTPFQRRVWREVARIPPGRTCSYGDIARRLNTSPRAVGNAMGANPMPIMIPCHRVVGRNGLGGFMGADRGWGMDIKKWLLDHESAPQFS